MPLLRYFTVVGAALIALLFVVSSFLPEAETVTHRDVARPVIRIASDRVGPPRVDLDTRRQTVVLPALVPDLELVPQSPAREAEAQLAAPLPTPAASTMIERKNARIAKRPDRQRMAANPQGGQPFHLTW
jgi:hypothetical protein